MSTGMGIAAPLVIGDSINASMKGGLCDWLPFLYKSDYCRIPTVQEIVNDQSNFGPAMTPANKAQVALDTQATIDAFMASDPAAAANYNDALAIQAANPFANLLTGNNPNGSTTLLYAALAVAAVAGLMLVSR